MLLMIVLTILPLRSLFGPNVLAVTVLLMLRMSQVTLLDRLTIRYLMGWWAALGVRRPS